MERFLARDPVKKGILEPIMVRIKYDSYMWNYNRLAEPLQNEFIKRFQDDFLRHEMDGTIRSELYENYKFLNIEKILINPALFHLINIREKNGEKVPDFYKANDHPERKDLWVETPFLIRKAIGAFYCIKDHGVIFSVRLLWKKVKRKLSL